MSCVIRTSTTCLERSEDLPIAVDYARRHIRGIASEEDDLIQGWIHAAAQYFEEQTGRPIMRSTWAYWLEAFPVATSIELPRPPLVSVESVQYIGSDGSFSDWVDGSPSTALWEVVAPEGIHARRGWITPIGSGVWPTPGLIVPGAVRIAFTAGYAETAADVPDLIKAALLMIVGSFDQFRSEQHFSTGARVEEVPFGAAQILDGFKKTAMGTQALYRR
jgi:uncharacterized phiE125 gp8 family phage protein